MKKIALLALGLSAILLSEVNAATSLSFEEREVDRGLAHQRLHIQRMTDCLSELSQVHERQAVLEKVQLRFTPKIDQDLETAVSAVNAINEQLKLMETYCLESLDTAVLPERRVDLDRSYDQCRVVIRLQEPHTGFASYMPDSVVVMGEYISEVPITYSSLGLMATNVQRDDASRQALGIITDAKLVCSKRSERYAPLLTKLKKDQGKLLVDVQITSAREEDLLRRISISLSSLTINSADSKK